MRLNSQFDTKKFLFYSTFILVSVCFSIIIHKLGHFVAAKLLGYQPTLHYNKVTFEKDNFFYLLKEGSVSITLKEKLETHKLIWSAWGIITTLLIGSIGFIGLLIQNTKSAKFNNLTFFFILLSLNLLRNAAVVLVMFSSNLIGIRSVCDEFTVETALNLPPFSLFLSLAILGLLIFSIVLIKFVSSKLMKTFIFSLIIGGSLGSILWLFVLGPILVK